jgi:maltooligosyltrehalose synthase
LPRGLQTWETTHIRLDAELATRRYRNLLTGDIVQASGGELPLADVLRTCPVAILWSDAPDA